MKAFILTKSSDERQTLLAKAGTVGGDTTQPTSWEHVNNSVIERLYKAHGNDLEFVGVILHRTRFEFFEEKQLSAKQAAKLARWMGAQGAARTWPGAGNVFIEAMLIAQALEYAKSDQSSNFRQTRKGYVSSLYL